MFKAVFFIFLIFGFFPKQLLSKTQANWLEIEGEKNFSNIIVISKKFLRKTNKIEIFTYGAFSIDNAFYTEVAPSIDITYYFKEKYAISLSYLHFFNFPRLIIKQLRDAVLNDERQFKAKKTLGLYFHWSPVYGKITFLNKKLIPFDLYFSLGLAQINATYKKPEGARAKFSGLAVSGQVGQQFALTPSLAFHWKILSSVYFRAPNKGGERNLSYQTVFGMGLSWFFGADNTR